MAGLQTASHRLPAMKDKQRKVNTTRRQGEASNDIQMNSENRRAVCVPPFIKSAQISNTNSPGNAAEVSNDIQINIENRRAVCVPPFIKSAKISNTNSPGNAAVPHTLNVDERLRLARERREERERQLLSKELGWQAREERARRYYERQLEERRSRLLEQREREERRRHAVEEKRTQRLREEKERHENAVRRTLEKSQRAKQTLTQGSRGRKNAKNNAGPGRVPLSPWEKNLVNRLLTPTCSYLARSKSAGGQSREEAPAAPHKAQCHAGPVDHRTPSNPVCTRTQHHSGPTDHRTTSAPSRTVHRIINLAQTKAEKTQENERKLCNGGPPQTADANSRAGSSTNSANRPTAPSPKRPQNKYVTRRVTPKQLDLCVVPEEDGTEKESPEKDGPDSSSSLSPGNAESVTAPAVRSQERVDRSASSDPYPNSPEPQRAAAVRTEGGETPPAGGPGRPLAGTMDPEEASRLLAERRRGVRLQRERREEEQRRERQEGDRLQRERQEEEQQRERREEERLQRERQEEERLQREEAERRGRQDLERRRAEARARREAEAQHVTEERKRRREEEEQEQARAEIARKATEEAALLQREREEELARQQEKAEQLRTEREKVFQREEAERQARKKRLEEIMRRTRKSDPVDKKPPPIENVEAQPKENTERGQSGTIEEALKPCQLGPKPCPLGLPAVDDMVPVVAFKERKSLRTLTGLEEIQAHQRAEVI